MNKIQAIIQDLQRLCTTMPDSILERDVLLEKIRRLYEAALSLEINSKSETSNSDTNYKGYTGSPFEVSNFQNTQIETITGAEASESSHLTAAEQRAKALKERWHHQDLKPEANAAPIENATINLPLVEHLEDVFIVEQNIKRKPQQELLQAIGLGKNKTNSKDIRQWIGLNDQLWYITTLFNNNDQKYHAALDEINQLEHEADAKQLLGNLYCADNAAKEEQEKALSQIYLAIEQLFSKF